MFSREKREERRESDTQKRNADFFKEKEGESSLVQKAESELNCDAHKCVVRV